MDGVLEKSAVKRVKQALISNGLSTEITVLTESARSAAEAASALGIEVGQIASSIIFKLSDQKPLLVITSGRHRVNTEWTNPPAIVIIDEALSEYEVVWAAAGHPHAVFPSSFNELKSIANATALVVGA